MRIRGGGIAHFFAQRGKNQGDLGQVKTKNKSLHRQAKPFYVCISTAATVIMHDYRDDDDKKVINNIFQFAKLRRIRNGTAPVEPKKNVVFYNCVLKICQLR